MNASTEITTPDTMMPPAREDAAAWTRNLTRKFGEETAVADVSMTLPQGKIFGFIGP
jgi:ABC-type transporter Mla maintaining outer membrane lipid asymmetry ATPase subunit MlaF